MAQLSLITGPVICWLWDHAWWPN